MILDNAEELFEQVHFFGTDTATLACSHFRSWPSLGHVFTVLTDAAPCPALSSLNSVVLEDFAQVHVFFLTLSSLLSSTSKGLQRTLRSICQWSWGPVCETPPFHPDSLPGPRTEKVEVPFLYTGGQFFGLSFSLFANKIAFITVT